jgi:arsenate reductase (glutaredoxin)
MAITIYGIKNCDTMKKVFHLFEQEGIEFRFVDYKKNAPTTELLRLFLDKISLDELVNRKGTTYKKLSEEEKASIQHVADAIPLLREKSSMIKRPIIVFTDGSIQVGFDEKAILSKIRDIS